ncbi:hypothetical protein GF325_00630 [Candidatus Bathyarchaeota archaeon]|nr:hypothetical protein [Candidatus Bathyarchaeota archaeon]
MDDEPMKKEEMNGRSPLLETSRARRAILAIALLMPVLVLNAGFTILLNNWEDLHFPMSEEEKIDFTLFSMRYEQEIWGEPNITAANSIAAKLTPSSQGLYFSDLDYDDESRANWNPWLHLGRLLLMIKYYGKDVLALDHDALTMVLGTLDYWLNRDLQSLNWWYNRIAVPQHIGDIGILLGDHLTGNRHDKVEDLARRGILITGGLNKMTGANLIDAVETTIKYAVLTGKGYFLKMAVARAEEEIIITGGSTQGIKQDYTFYQHGVQQAITSYGVVYTSGLAELAGILGNSTFQFSEEKIGILVDFMLHGQRYAIRGNWSNYLGNGRSFSRANGNNARSIKSAVATLLELEKTPKKGELQEFHDSFDNLSLALNESKYFPFSYTLVTMSPTHYMAAKGAFDGFINSEMVNSENRLGKNLGYGGVTTYQFTGAEYNDISAIMDFSMWPGTTAFHETDEVLAEHGNRYRSTTTHSGGAAEGVVGGLYVDIENEGGLYSRQAYACYRGLMVCLGTAITCTDPQNINGIFTTVNQVFAENASSNGVELEPGTTVINSTSVVSNGAFAYYHLDGTHDLTASVTNESGSLARNNPSQTMTLTDEVFKLYYAFGPQPVNESFAYAVLANVDGDAPANASNLGIAKITNTDSVQAVEFSDGTTVVIFHEMGTHVLLNGTEVSATTHCVKIY